MDHFGIGTATQAAFEIYAVSARQTGRTTSLVESLKDGDRVIFTNSVEARRVEIMCEARGIKIETQVVDPRTPSKVFDRQTAQGRVIFDHSWVEEFYRLSLQKASEEIDHLQVESSGYGFKHYETRQQAMELARWGYWK